MNPMIDDGSHTDFFGSTAGAVTGCTRIQQTGHPEALSAAAARGCAGQMIVPAQAGGYGYSFGDGAVTGLRASGKAGLPNMNRYANVGLNSDLSHGAYNQNTAMTHGGRRKSRKLRRSHGKKHSRKTRRFHKGSRSITRKGHKDFMTYKGSKMYDEKRLKKLIGRKTVRAPIFSFAGGKRKGYRKGSKSVTRPGHEDFMTYKGSKMYNEKRLKKLIGRKTMRAPIFPFAGGAMMPKVSSPSDVTQSAKLGSESSVLEQVQAGRPCDEANSQGCSRATAGPRLSGGAPLSMIKGADNVVGVNTVQADADHSGNLLYGGRRRRNARKMRGGYCQYMSNVPFSMGQSVGDVKLSASQSALASPPPFKPYSHCQ
jgi:hypothetical protein